MEPEDIERLRMEDLAMIEELRREPHECPYTSQCCESKYNQCYDHSHVLCRTFEKYYSSQGDRRNRII